MAESTNETPVLDLLASMTADSIEASSLDPETLMLVRIAALAAVDAPPVSYLLNLGAAGETGIDPEQVRGVLAAIAPIVGTARVASATGNIARRSRSRSRSPSSRNKGEEGSVTRRFAASPHGRRSWCLVPALGCGSDDEDNAATEAATGANGDADTGTRTLGEGIESLQEAQAQLCPELADVEADLTEVSTSGTEAGQDVLEASDPFRQLSSPLLRLSPGRGRGRGDRRRRPCIPPGVALHVQRGGSPSARRRGGRRAQQLTDALQCP